MSNRAAYARRGRVIVPVAPPPASEILLVMGSPSDNQVEFTGVTLGLALRLLPVPGTHITRFDLLLERVGSLAVDMQPRIYRDATGLLGSLAQSGPTVPFNNVGLSFGYFAFEGFDVSLGPSERVWIALYTPGLGGVGRLFCGRKTAVETVDKSAGGVNWTVYSTSISLTSRVWGY